MQVQIYIYNLGIGQSTSLHADHVAGSLHLVLLIIGLNMKNSGCLARVLQQETRLMSGSRECPRAK
jgi:hypothetical protein